MKKITYALTSGALIALLGATTAFADEHAGRTHLAFGGDLGIGAVVRSLAQDQNKGDNEEGIGAEVQVLAHSQHDATASKHEDQDNDGDRNNEGEKESARLNATTTAEILQNLGLNAGQVTTLNGGTFTINPVGAKATTTVVTNANTRFSALGQATTSAAVKVGSVVIVKGTASSTAPDTVTADFVLVINNVLGFLKQLFE